jgi:hypothetical protein
MYTLATPSSFGTRIQCSVMCRRRKGGCAPPRTGFVRGRVVVCQPSITLPIAHPRCLAGACGGGAIAAWAGRAPGHGGLRCHVGALPSGMYRLAHLTLRSTYMGAPVVVVGKLRDLHQPVHSTGACVTLVLHAAVGRQLQTGHRALQEPLEVWTQGCP